MPLPTGAAEEGGSPPREARGAPPAPPPSASSGNPLASVTSSLRRAGTQVKRLGRKILADTTSVLPGGFQSKDKGGRSDSGRDGSGPNAGWCDENDGERDGGHQKRLNSPGANEKTTKTTPRARLSRPRYLDLGPLDPRHVLDIGAHFADSADPPEGYVNVWQGNFRRWQKRWLAATTPGALTMHRRASKIGPSVSVDLSNAAVLVAEATSGGSRSSLSNAKKTSSSSSSRQFLIVTPEKTYRIRALHARCRAPWVACIERSAERLERARALVRSRGKAPGGGSVSGGNSFSRKAKHVEKRRNGEKRAEENETKRPSPVSLPGGDDPRRGGAHRRVPSAELKLAYETPARLAAAKLECLHSLRARFLSAETNPALHEARARAEALAASALDANAGARARGFVGVVGSFMSGGGAETAAETAARSADSADSAETVDALQSAPPRDVVAAVAALRAAYDSTLAAALERCALAEERAARHQTRSAHLASALAEFTGVVPSPSAAAGETHVGFRDFSGESSHTFPQNDASTHDGELGRERDANSTSKSNSVARVIVTPGESGFAAALRGVGESGSGARTKLDGDALFFVRSSEDSSGASDASSGVSDEYGSVLSFATGVSHASHGSAGIARGSSDDLDLLVAEAAEVVNRHDFVISRKAEREDDEDSLDEDDADDASSVSSGTANASNSESDEEEDEEAYGRAKRERLPAPQPLNQSFSIWDLLRKNMGKDLSRISMPANINQPLSLLQRTVEDFEYLDLLYEAIDCDCDCDATLASSVDEKNEKKTKKTESTNRVALLATFAASSYASWYGRAQKPFASTLGETYDWTSPDKRVRVVCECVVYDPPVAAFHAFGTTPRGTPFSVHGEGMGTSKFYGRYVQVNVKGGLHLELPRTRERYSWSKAAMHVHNVISGRVWVDMVGEVNVQAHPVFETDPSTGAVEQTRGGERASFRLKKGSKPNPGKPDARGALEGNVFDRHGVQTATLTGNCLDALWICTDETYAGDAPVRLKKSFTAAPVSETHSVRDAAASAEASSVRGMENGGTDDARDARTDSQTSQTKYLAWRFGGLARDAARQYGFTPFAIALNELTPEGTRNLPPTDSRFRPDMRALENGDSEEASRAKARVEDRNRALALARRKKGETYAPAWFARRVQSSPNNDEVHDEGNASSLSRIPEEPLATSPGRGSSPGDVSSPGSSQKSGVAFTEKTEKAPAPFGKHVNTLENRTSLWVYRGAYWEQRETGEFVEPAVATDERFDVFGVAAAWRAERDRRRETRKTQNASRKRGLDGED